MSLDLDTLLAPLSEEAPCGDDLSYDPAYMELERAIQGTGEQQMGDSVIEAQEPNWREIRSNSLELLGRTRDLRVIIYLMLAELKMDGIPGLRDGMTLLSRSLEQYWDTVHPQLDPDDDNDPMERMNILASIALRAAFQDPVSFLKRLREMTVVSAPQVGSFSYYDMQIASGHLPAPESMTNPPQTAHIAGAFASGDQEAIQASSRALNETVDMLNAVNTFVVNTVGSGNAPDLSGIEEILGGMQRTFSEYAGGAEAPPPEVDGEGMADAVPGQASAPAPQAGLSGEIHTRDDVLKAIDKITRYYEKFEPSSPLPMLLARARRLVSAEFVDIVKDLTPDSMPQIQLIGGLPPEESEY